MTSAPLPWDAAGLLLDMDGTLADSTASVVRCWDRLFAELGAQRTFTPELHGMPARQVLETALPDLTPQERDEALARVEQLEIEDAGTIAVLPGAMRVLEELQAASGELGRPTWTVVTSATRELFEARWRATGLPVPEDCVTADQVTRGKPAPEPYLLGAERIGIDPASAVVVEDSPGGLRSARAAGARGIAVTTTQTAAELTPLADVMLTSMDDLSVSASQGGLHLARRGA